MNNKSLSSENVYVFLYLDHPSCVHDCGLCELLQARIGDEYTLISIGKGVHVNYIQRLTMSVLKLTAYNEH